MAHSLAARISAPRLFFSIPTARVLCSHLFLSCTSAAVDKETHKLTQDELDDLAEEMGYASNSDDDDEEMHEKRMTLCEEDRLRARVERRARRHAANLANDRTPLHLPGEPMDEETRRLRLMYQAAGLPVRGSVEVLPDTSPHIEHRWGEDRLRKGTQIMLSTQDAGGLVTEGVLSRCKLTRAQEASRNGFTGCGECANPSCHERVTHCTGRNRGGTFSLPCAFCRSFSAVRTVQVA